MFSPTRGHDNSGFAERQDLLRKLGEILLRDQLAGVHWLSKQLVHGLAIIRRGVVIGKAHQEGGGFVDFLPELPERLLAQLAVEDGVGQEHGLAGLTGANSFLMFRSATAPGRTTSWPGSTA